MANFAVVSFAGVTLPAYAPEHDLGTDESLSAYVPVPWAPAYNVLGSEQAQGKPREIAVRCMAVNGTETTLQTTLDSVRALRGKYGALSIALADGTSRTRNARCERIEHPRRAGEKRYHNLTLYFQCDGSGWQGAQHAGTGDYIVTLNTSPKSMEISNGGNDIVRDLTVTVKAGGANITAVTIANAETGHVSSLTYTGTVTAGQSLVIDTGAWTVKNNGADAWGGVTFGGTHAIREMLRLAPGANTINVTLTGGSTDSTVAFAFYDLWS
jgi:hypothetical protein